MMPKSRLNRQNIYANMCPAHAHTRDLVNSIEEVPVYISDYQMDANTT